MTTKTLELEARSPEWLIAKADLARAERAAKSAAGVPGELRRHNERHAEEVREKRATSSYPLITNAQAQMRGGGSGAEVIYRRCSCDAAKDYCEHDPAESPHSAEVIAAAEADADRAAKVADKARKALAAIPQTFDAAAAARKAGARYVYWPARVAVDPRRHHYRGRAVTDAEVSALGIHGLNRALANGSIIEVPA